MFKVEDVRRAASGRWLQILADLAPELEVALGRIGRHVPCPVHGGKDGFRVFRDVETTGGGCCNTCGAFSDGFALLGWLKNWRFPEALAAVAGAVRLTESEANRKVVRVSSPVVQVPSRQYRNEDEDNKLRARIYGMWSEAIAVMHPQALVAQRYFSHRKLSVRYAGTLHQALRFHPKVPYFDEEGRVVANYPALLCNVSDKDSNLVTLHRIYLGFDGYKAPVENSKKMMSIPNGMTVTGCSIKLGAAVNSAISYAEGVETALASHMGSGLIVWSTVNATLMESQLPPTGTEEAFIFADRDRSERGEEAAKKLKARLWEMGIRAQILLPPMPIPESSSGVDWNDVWLTYGPAGFPHRGMFVQVA